MQYVANYKRTMCTQQVPFDHLRVYTTQFAAALLQVYKTWCQQPATERGELRGRRSVDVWKSDRELFAAMERKDLWLESNIHQVFLYLYNCKHCKTPSLIELVACNKSTLPLCPSPIPSNIQGSQTAGSTSWLPSTMKFV